VTRLMSLLDREYARHNRMDPDRQDPPPRPKYWIILVIVILILIFFFSLRPH
jgi:hypothetical protein